MARFQRTGRQREFRLGGSLDGEDVGDALSHGDDDGRQIDPNTAFLICARHQPLRPVIVSIAIGSASLTKLNTLNLNALQDIGQNPFSRQGAPGPLRSFTEIHSEVATGQILSRSEEHTSELQSL